MDIKIDRDGSKMVMTVSGRIDTLTAPELTAKKSELVAKIIDVLG